MTSEPQAMLEDLIGEDAGALDVECVSMCATVGGRRVLRKISRRDAPSAADPAWQESRMWMLADYFEFTVGTEAWVRLEYCERETEARE